MQAMKQEGNPKYVHLWKLCIKIQSKYSFIFTRKIREEKYPTTENTLIRLENIASLELKN